MDTMWSPVCACYHATSVTTVAVVPAVAVVLAPAPAAAVPQPLRSLAITTAAVAAMEVSNRTRRKKSMPFSTCLPIASMTTATVMEIEGWQWRMQIMSMMSTMTRKMPRLHKKHFEFSKVAASMAVVASMVVHPITTNSSKKTMTITIVAIAIATTARARAATDIRVAPTTTTGTPTIMMMTITTHARRAVAREKARAKERVRVRVKAKESLRAKIGPTTRIVCRTSLRVPRPKLSPSPLYWHPPHYPPYQRQRICPHRRPKTRLNRLAPHAPTEKPWDRSDPKRALSRVPPRVSSNHLAASRRAPPRVVDRHCALKCAVTTVSIRPNVGKRVARIRCAAMVVPRRGMKQTVSTIATCCKTMTNLHRAPTFVQSTKTRRHRPTVSSGVQSMAVPDHPTVEKRVVTRNRLHQHRYQQF
jgi:hypothetical protein